MGIFLAEGKTVNELITEKGMTFREVARATGASYRTIAKYAHKAGWTRNGIKTFLTVEQVTVILEAMKGKAFNGVGEAAKLAGVLQGIETPRSRALRIDLLHKQIEAELEAEIRGLKAEVRTLKTRLHESNTLLDLRTSGLQSIQRIAEVSALVISDRDDVAAACDRTTN
jgi:transcriptional regulator with XRE-family HTH domain